MKNSDPEHPRYGTLDELLRMLRKDITEGRHISVMHMEALNWFTDAYLREGAVDDPRPAA